MGYRISALGMKVVSDTLDEYNAHLENLGAYPYASNIVGDSGALTITFDYLQEVGVDP